MSNFAPSCFLAFSRSSRPSNCERSLALWQEVRDREMLNSQDAGKPEFAAQELAACNDLLARR